MALTRVVASSLALVFMALGPVKAQQTVGLIADVQAGKKVFRTKGCVNCHGWAADGKTGISLKYPPGPSIRESTLDAEAMIEVIACGRPGTDMPFHDRAAYRDDRCYGLVFADFNEDDVKPVRGKTFSQKDMENLVAYLQTQIVGLGKPTYDECADFFDNPDAGACRLMK